MDDDVGVRTYFKIKFELMFCLNRFQISIELKKHKQAN